MTPDEVAAYAKQLAEQKGFGILLPAKGTRGGGSKVSSSDSEGPSSRSVHENQSLPPRPAKFQPVVESVNKQGENLGDKAKEKSNLDARRGKPLAAKEYSADDFQRILEPASQPDKYKLVSYENAAEMLYTVDPNFRGGDEHGKWSVSRDLYDWQLEFHELTTRREFTQHDPLKFYLRAANGSGKDAYVIAPFAVWFALCKIRARVIITSASYTQIEGQTENYIRTLCNQVNDFFQEEVFYIRKLHIVCKWTGSEIKMFSTDDPGRAEGYHPFPDYHGAEMAIIINEAKTVSDVIFDALKRCTGFNYWLEVSSPGPTSGHFYKVCSDAADYNPEETVESGTAYTKKVSAYECANFSHSELDKIGDEVGRDSAWFRSSVLAEFSTLDEAVVINRDIIDKLLLSPTQHLRVSGEVSHKKCGVDLGFSKDETVAWVIDGNKLVDMLSIFQNDTTLQADRLVLFFEKHGLKGEDIAVDDSNFGHSVNDMFRARGYEVRRVTNQSRAHTTKMYGNRGAEMWFNFKRLVELKLVHGLDKVRDKVMINQLCNRYYKQTEANGKLMLESKKEARAKGHPSPDRADALILAFSFYNVVDFMESADSVEDVRKRQATKGMTAADFARYYEDNVQYKRPLNNSSTEHATRVPANGGVIPTVRGLVRKKLKANDGNDTTMPFKFKSVLD